MLQSIDRESIAKAHLRLTAIMQRHGPDIAKQARSRLSVGIGKDCP